MTGTTAPGQSSDLNIFGLDSKTLEEGAERYKERYKDSIFPEYIEEGANIFQNIFGASDMGDGELSTENQKENKFNLVINNSMEKLFLYCYCIVFVRELALITTEGTNSLSWSFLLVRHLHVLFKRF